MIYHITNRKYWEASEKINSYSAESLLNEGFIHCSPKEKILQSAEKFFNGKSDLIVLHIDEQKIKSKILWEDLYDNGYNFPHIYGKLNIDAVVRISELIPCSKGKFELPENF